MEMIEQSGVQQLIENQLLGWLRSTTALASLPVAIGAAQPVSTGPTAAATPPGGVRARLSPPLAVRPSHLSGPLGGQE